MEPSWWNFNCVSSLKFQFLGQDGLEHIFDCYRSVCFSYFSIILLLKKKFQGKKNPNYLNCVIVTGSNDIINLCLFH